MTIIVMGISFTVIWLGTTFFILRYVKRLKDDLLKKVTYKEKPSEKKIDLEDAWQLCGVYNPFPNFKRADPENLYNFIKREHPQIIALILAHLEPEKASIILQKFPPELRGDVSGRIAVLDRVSPEVTLEIEKVLEKKLGAMSGGRIYTKAGSVESIAGILNHVDSGSQKQIIKAIEDKDPELAYNILKQFPSLLKNWYPAANSPLFKKLT